MTKKPNNPGFPETDVDSQKRRLLLCAKDLRKAFGGQQILNGVSLSIYKDDVILLRGANGSGKTVLLNILTGNLEPDSGEIFAFTSPRRERFKFPTGVFRYLNFVRHFTPERMSIKGVTRTWQEIRLFNSLDLRDNISVATPLQEGENPFKSVFRRSMVLMQERQVRSASERALGEIGLGDRSDSLAAHLSLGESKKVSIMQAVQSIPKIIFLDEPLAGLDASGITEVVGLLRKLNRERGIALVIIEHTSNIPKLEKLATITLMLENGKIFSEEEFHKRGDKGSAGRANGEHRPIAPTQAKGSVELLNGARLTTSVARDRGPVALEILDLVVYRNKRLVIGTSEKDGSVKGLSFTLMEGQEAVLQAPNGWGKTTLLEAIAGLKPINSGSIKMFGKPVNHLPPWRRSNLGVYLLRAGKNFFASLTVQETLRLSGVNNAPSYLIPILDRRMAQLSGGERQLVAVVCAYGAKGPKLLLLDEPFLGLDGVILEELTELMKNRSGITTIIATPL